MLRFSVIPIVVVVISLFMSYLHLMISEKSELKMANTGLLFVSNVTKAKNYFLKASKCVQKVLYIKVNETTDIMPSISREIVQVYSKATSHCNNLNVRLILKTVEPAKKIHTQHPIDLILYDNTLANEIDSLQQSIATLTPGHRAICLETSEEISQGGFTEEVKVYEYVAVGGTFDRLHNGHKILLSQAALRTSKELTVGVTDVNMIQSKKLWELIEPTEQRIKSVLEFLKDIKPDIEYNVVPIQDMYGPTKDDPKYQLLVVSEETERGVDKINEKRVEKQLLPLARYVIGLAEDSQHSELEEAKVSSSNQRMRLLGTTIQPPVPNPTIPERPYVIGLAGGIASGKSYVAERLKEKGAGVVNCDLIAHELYSPGTALNGTIAETFGRHVITDGGAVDRKKLGQIVFGDKNQLERLNQLLWPAIMEETKRRIAAFGEQGYSVVVLEAAVMVRAQWYRHCHQLWVTIIPADVAIERLQKRNGLTEEEARQRIQSQPSNMEQVSLANVVFSPWKFEHTHSQVDKAWAHLQEFLNTRQSSKI